MRLSFQCYTSHYTEVHPQNHRHHVLCFFIETDIRKYASVFTFLSETFAIKACIDIQKQTININMCFS